jgi:hypothetical protein
MISTNSIINQKILSGQSIAYQSITPKRRDVLELHCVTTKSHMLPPFSVAQIPEVRMKLEFLSIRPLSVHFICRSFVDDVSKSCYIATSCRMY